MPREASSRFHCPSITLDLKHLLSKNRRWVYLSVMVAVCVHLVATRWASFQVEQRAVQPLTTQFVKRAPRLTKPLEMKKRPRPKRRMMQRKMVSIQARVNRKEVSSVEVSTHVLGKLARPDASIYRETAFAQTGLETEAMASYIEGTMQPKDNVNMALEMMDIDALDTGRYHAMVIQDPTDKRNIRGFFHLGICYSESMRMVSFHGADSRITYGLLRLVRTMNKYTNVKADIRGRFPFDSEEMFKTPWIGVAAVASFEPTVSEKMNLGKYLTGGGFLFADSWGNLDMPESIGALRSLWFMIINALATQGFEHGQMWDFEILPNSHPAYHCFFDFDGPPTGADRPSRMSSGPAARGADRFLRGVHIYGRLVCIYSNKGYFVPWGDWGPDGAGTRQGHDYSRLDPTRQLQFGVNLIIFALTQEGSITNRVMDAVR